MQMPEPDARVIARKAEIVRRLRAAVAARDAVIDGPSRAARLRVRRADRLSLPAAGGGAAVDRRPRCRRC